jgi:hypothetical protein
MSKSNSLLKAAIQDLNIQKPYDLRAQMKPALKKPAEITVGAQVEQPQNKDTQARPAKQGFFMLAHSVFENLLIQKLSGDAFRIFIWMSAQAWRYRESNGQFRAAVDYITVNCGCSRSTVTRALADLKEQGLIECMEQNFKKGNLWRVSRVADGRNEEAESELPQTESSRNESEAGSKSGGSVLKKNTKHAQNEQQIINPLQENFKNPKKEADEFFDEIEEKWKRFCEEFSDEGGRAAKLKELLEGLPFAPSSELGRNMAMVKWF